MIKIKGNQRHFTFGLRASACFPGPACWVTWRHNNAAACLHPLACPAVLASTISFSGPPEARAVRALRLRACAAAAAAWVHGRPAGARARRARPPARRACRAGEATRDMMIGPDAASSLCRARPAHGRARGRGHRDVFRPGPGRLVDHGAALEQSSSSRTASEAAAAGRKACSLIGTAACRHVP